VIDESRVLDALSTVCDPELDEPITELGFVKEVRIDEDAVTVALWLPTYFCAPNFAYIMAADAKAAVRALDPLSEVRVLLVDHHASDEINDSLAEDKEFDDTFPEETAGTGLADLRLRFNKKAFIARQEQLYRSLIAGGLTPTAVTGLRIVDLPEGPETRRYLDRRARVLLPVSGDAPFLVTAEGVPISEDDLDRYLLFARAVSVSIEGNASFCRGLLATRYDLPAPKEATR
jgi:metal-sulfur cluster biosynthetic enzyme